MMEKKGGKKKKKQRTLVYKPYLKGSWHDAASIRKSLRILAYYLIFVLIFLVMGAVLSTEIIPLAWLVNGLIVLGCGALLYMEGCRDGDNQVAVGEIAYTRQENGNPVEKKERDRCFHPLKGLFTALCGALPVILVAIVHALVAKKQGYALQPLPEWVTALGKDSEAMAPLQYYLKDGGFTLIDGIRVVGRMLIFPFAQVARLYGADAVLLADRLSPLLVLIPALGYPLGYLTGPRSRAMVHGDIQTNDRRYRRKQQKAVRERRTRTEKKNELI